MVSEDLSEVLREFARTMVTDFPIQGILDHLVKRIVDILPITAAGVTLISPGTEPRYIAASNRSALRFERLQTELDEGPCVAAYRTGEAVAVPDLRNERRFARFAPRALEAGMAAVFTFPLRHGDAVALGALDLYRDTPGELSPDAMSAAQTLADVAAAYIINAQARSDLEESSDRSREAALHDALTGLPNRVLLFERLKHASLRRRRSGSCSALLFVDIDRFKEVNDTYGHHVGDELLVAMAGRLPEVLRPGDTLARLSGDEFVVLCEDLENEAEADAIALRIDAALSTPFTLSGHEVRVSASIGMAFTEFGGDSPERLLHDADLAMYSMKRQGRGAGPLDRRRPGRAARHGDLEKDLPGAAERDELALAYQPIVTAKDGAVVGVEALLRWAHPGRGAIPPALVIPLAERSGLILALGAWVLERAWADELRWQREGIEDLGVSVNVSAHQLMSRGFARSVAAVLETARLDPALLTLEITETVFVRDGERALVVLDELKDMGVMLALDDFGTGFSSLSYLMRYPVDFLKVDQAFIAGLGRDPASRTVVAGVVDLAHSLGMIVVSEGVETREQRDHLAELGCDRCQGFYFGRPMSMGELDGLIRSHGEAGGLRLPAGQATTP